MMFRGKDQIDDFVERSNSLSFVTFRRWGVDPTPTGPKGNDPEPLYAGTLGPRDPSSVEAELRASCSVRPSTT
jgi:hypothetical protein